MAKAFDCATPLSASLVRQFIQDGYTAVCRYLAPPGSWKRLTEQEAAVISCTDEGLYIVSVFERGADNARSGSVQGAEDGQLALQFAIEVGQPACTPIYAAVDFDATAGDYDAIEAYLRSFDEQLTGYECAVYGEYEVCQAMLERCVVKRVWQTYAWSRGQKLDDPNIYQFENDIEVNGVGVDLDETNGDAGGWMIGMAITQQTLISEHDANDMIDSYLQKAWKQFDRKMKRALKAKQLDDAAAWEQLRDHQKHLANQIRKASGQPEE